MIFQHFIIIILLHGLFIYISIDFGVNYLYINFDKVCNVWVIIYGDYFNYISEYLYKLNSESRMFVSIDDVDEIEVVFRVD